MNEKLYYVEMGDDDIAEPLFDSNGELIFVFDVYHEDSMPFALLDTLGYEIVSLEGRLLIASGEFEDVDRTNQVPNLQEITHAVQKIVESEKV